MKIEFDKALLWLVPYLYFASVAYYWGYWGNLRIDTFNYYAVSDLIKGVTYPLGVALIYTSSLLPLVVLNIIISKFGHENGRPRPLIIFPGIILSILLGYIFLKYGIDNFMSKRTKTTISPTFKTSIISVLWYTSCVFAAIFFQYYDLVKRMKIHLDGLRSGQISTATPAPDWSTLSASIFISTFFLVFFIGRSYLTGRENAIRVTEGKEFDYVVSDSIACPQKKMYKYLGKAGDYYIMSNLNQTQSIAIKSDKLNPLVIENYSLDNPSSVVRFEEYYKQCMVVPIKLSLKQSN